MQHVKMYTVQTCSYCLRAKALLKQRGVGEIDEVRVDLHPAQRTAMYQSTNSWTVPQIFISNTHVGGYDQLLALDQSGGLEPMLASCTA